MKELWQIIYSHMIEIIDQPIGKRKQVYGRDLMDLPAEELMLYGTKLPYGDGTVELTLTTQLAQATFQWQAEITVKTSSKVEHYLLRPDYTIVETYGKNVYDVSLDKARKLKDEMAELKHRP